MEKTYKHPYWEHYYLSGNGSVYSVYGSELKPIEHHTGYHVYTFRQYRVQKQVRAHRFVWECVNGLIPVGLVINHLDGNKHNNAIENLELTTPKGNTRHAFETGLMKGKPGESNSRSKLTEAQFREVARLIVEEGASNKDIAALFDLHPNYVSLIRHRKRWRKSWDELGY